MKNRFYFIVMLLLPVFSKAERVYSKMERDVAVISYQMPKAASLFEISELFNVNVADLALANQTEPKTVLQKGFQLSLPVSALLQPSCEDECVEVYYEIKPREGLYRICKNFGYQNTTVVKKLNTLKSESLQVGQLLLMGYIDKSLLAKSAANEDSIKKSEGKIVATSQTSEPAFTGIREAANTVAEKTDSLASINMHYSGEGFFKADFEQGTHTSNLHASTFKTEAGWRDGKFYVLADHIPVGTVVKMKHPITGAVVYAKVLGALPKLPKKDLAQIRMCTAAAGSLGMKEDDMADIVITY